MRWSGTLRDGVAHEYYQKLDSAEEAALTQLLNSLRAMRLVSEVRTSQTAPRK
jgi:hypothetical protein